MSFLRPLRRLPLLTPALKLTAPHRAFSTSPPALSLSQLALKPKRLYLTASHQPAHFDLLFLRDACPCPKCVDPSTRQKLFATTDLPVELAAKEASLLPATDGQGQALKVVWADGHESLYPAEMVEGWTTLKGRLKGRWNEMGRVLWDREVYRQREVRIAWEEYMGKEKGLWEALRGLEQFGLVFVDGVPDDEGAVQKIAERIGCLKRTFYGDTWDVRSVVDAKNIAYTAQYLGLHMDLLYFESPPGIQLLHSLRNRATGGNSIFSDALRAAHHIRLQSELHLRTLAKFPVTFHYANGPEHYHFTRPIVALTPYSSADNREEVPRIDHINWAPPFQAPFEMDVGEKDGTLRQWFGIAKEFAGKMERESSVFETRLEEGTCVLFQNRRVVHGRKEFDPESGERWFRGAYVDGDAYRSKLRILAERFVGSKGGKREAVV